FVYGAVERISPEAPIPVLRVERETTMLGGAGNVVRNLVALGAKARLVSVVGRDDAADQVRALFAEHSGISHGLVIDPDRRTSIKTRYLAASQQIMRADRETTATISDAAKRSVLEAVETLLPDCATVVLSDYGKGILTDGVVREILALARLADKAVIVDPKGKDYRKYRNADVITPNRLELAEATDRAVATREEVAAAARSLIDDHAFGAVVATLGQEGMAIVERDNGTFDLAAERREVFDVSGAGDTVVATIAAALAAGATLKMATEIANVSAGIVVGKVGTAVAYAAELEDALRHRDLSLAEAKVMGLAPAIDRIEVWRRQGAKVGFTNGCFDLLHPGHVSLLSQAKGACDRLVVGLNSDASVARLKGPERPIQKEMARAAVLASLATVDLVVIFGEDTPLKLLEALRPDVLVKGADYRIEEVVGADLVHGYGGKVVLAALEPGFSTTATIARIAE
ncbi:MAG: D-glycero-beta-D-manno-heptose 1-phosphate adenylyltransferase, partial [Rhodospirillales bacterium]|nr:D-glycero-beta-D-manno-heptose 1-phosphate adenylyltransferase [Rhodospirillales bacterium]